MTRFVHIGVAALAVLAGCDELGNADPFLGSDKVGLEDLGKISLTQNDSEPLTVTIPDDTASFAVVLSNLGGVLAQPATVKDPTGKTIFEVGVDNTNRSDAFPHVSTTLVPVNPAVDVAAGDWEFVFFASGAVDAKVDMVLKTGGVPSSGTLDLNIHLVGLEALTAETAPDDEGFQAILDGVAEIYQGAGITLGERSYFDVADERFAVLETTAVGSDELLTLLETETAQHESIALNLFFVQDIENPSSARSLLGVSGGVPGPTALHGTRRSGVAISMANYLGALEGAGDVAAASAELEIVVAHEMGHYLGLFHTTEANGTALDPGSGALHGHDPLSDTAECADSADANGDFVLAASECAGAAGNLMFWSPPNDARALSSAQREILRRNPVVQ